MNFNWYKLSKETDHNYSWVYIDLPKEIASKMNDFGKEIDPDDLYKAEADDGLETSFHATVKYGLLTKDVKEIKECLDGLKGGKVYMGSSSIFEGEKYDVIKITIESKALENLHNNLNKLPHEDKFMEYKAHATIAYVKKGKGKKYDKKFKIDKEFSFGEVFFGNNKKDFTIKLSISNFNLYRKSMALDPQSYKTEPQPARLPQHMDEAIIWSPTGKMIKIPQLQNQEEIDKLYSGVHFAFNQEIAALYACGKATASDPPVIIEIEPKGLKQQLDVDAMIDKDLRCYIDDKKKDWQIILESKEDIDIITEQIYENLDRDKDNWTMEGEASDNASNILIQETKSIPPSIIIEMIQNKNSQQVINIINSLISGNIPEKTMIQMVGQMRVNIAIDASRVKAIYQIPWIDFSAESESALYDVNDEYLEEKGWHREGDEVKNEKGQIILDYEDIIYNNWLSLTPLYINRQMYFRGYTSKNSIWHGTTLSRAKSAYPELLAHINIAEESKIIEAIESATNSWYKPPFMRSMDYMGATK